MGTKTFVGAGIGLVIGGPIGALIGAAIGYGLEQDDEDSASSYPTSDEEKEVVVITTLCALLSHVIKADNEVHPKEMREAAKFFHEEFDYGNEELEDIKKIMKESLRNPPPLDELIDQYKSLFPPETYQEILDVLYRIAMADGHLHESEQAVLNRIAELFGISDDLHQSIKGQYVIDNDKYYKVLGLSPSANVREIKQRYRQLVKDFHPDKIIGKGLPQEFIDFANERFRTINEAYEKVRAERGFT